VGVPGGVMGIEISEDKGVRRVRDKFRSKGAGPGIEWSISVGRG